MISAREYREVLQYTDLTATVREPTHIAGVILRGLLELVGGDGATLTHLDLRTGDEMVVQCPSLDPTTLQEYPTVAPQHPLRPPIRERLQRRWLAARPLRISDVMTTREWRSTALHALTHADVDDQVTMPVALGWTTVKAVALNRERGRFTDRQVDLLAMTRVQVSAALERTPPGQALGLRLSPDVGWAPLVGAPGLDSGSAPASGVLVPAVDLGLLSQRESMVAGLVAAGRTDQQIARSLGLRPATVSSHLRRIYARLGLANRAGLAAAWIAQQSLGDR